MSSLIGATSGGLITAGFRLPPAPSGSAGILQTLAAKRAALVATSEASIRWGKPSNFSVVGGGGSIVGGSGGGTVVVIWPPDTPPEDPPKQEPPPFQYNEEWRSTSKVRVENPDDSEQYVMVERVESIIFRGQDNKRIQLNFVNGKKA